MLRHIVGRSAAAAAGAAAATPTTSHCWSHAQPRSVLSQTRDNEFSVSFASAETAQGPAIAAKGVAELESDWLLASIDNNHFDAEEVSEAVSNILSIAPRTGGVRVHELDAASDSGSEGSSGGAHDLMCAADRQMVAYNEAQDRFGRTLTNLLSNPEVQRACVRALKDNPNFEEFLTSADNANLRIAVDCLLPAAAHAATIEEVGEAPKNPIAALLEALGAGCVRLGQALAPARDAAARLLLGIGLRIHSILGRPFQKEQAAGRARTPRDAWTDILMTVGCAVIAILLLKRVHHVSFARP